MYGAEPGKERNQGVMNQHIVSKLTLVTQKAFWIFHTRGENAVSILIASMKDAGAAADDVLKLISSIVVEHPLTEREWFSAMQEEVIAWGSETKLVKLEAAVTSAKKSAVIGWEKPNVAE